MLVVCFLFLAGFVGAYGYPEKGIRKRYDGYEVLEVRPISVVQQQRVHELRQDNEIDFWSEPRGFAQPAQLFIPPHKIDSVHRYLQHAGVDYTVQVADIQPALDAELERLDKRGRNTDTFEFDLDDWNSYEDIMAEMEEMADRCPEESGIICDTYLIGLSLEGRAFKALRISQVAGENEEPFQRQAIWVDSVIHGAEWLSLSTCLKIADRLTRSYETDETVRHLLDSYDWYILPVMNPDGYDFSFTTERFWRKNRRVNPDSECFGVDLNRNYDFMWGNVGGSTDPCSNNYQGTDPASELETVNIQEEAARLSDRLVAWISMHISGNMWLHPWGYVNENASCIRAEDHDEMYRVAEAAADATQDTYNTTWTRGTICEIIYPVAGTTCDYVKGVEGVKYSFTPELRGPGEPDVEEIEPAYQEIWNGIVAIVNAILEGPEN